VNPWSVRRQDTVSSGLGNPTRLNWQVASMVLEQDVSRRLESAGDTLAIVGPGERVKSHQHRNKG